MNEIIETKRDVEVVNGKNRVTELKYSGYYDQTGQFRLTRCISRIYTESVKPAAATSAA